ncbi:segregation and condensation protein A [Pseudothermotoga thermarum]|uniref:Segregation and condensation protein A n=1 Tax=Pseudothermotoga thermarum DSM 5069 TaxID=688269 RepID=F7YU35_9THEM|nr:ScpA family protein [Pseudothermotoga thermarum]AEH51624.1 chromosome segregation and condensation protein ScpA [Pseudothermotoga thermarum DSM 5069]
MELVFHLPVFEGPLDLLLYLVRKRKINIRDISISQLADEFIQYVEQMRKLDMHITSDFLVMASQLMEIKSKYLLPSLSKKEAEKLQQQEEEIYRRIELYEKIKNLAEDLNERLERFSGRKVVRLSGLPFIHEEKLKKIIKSVLEEIRLRTNVYKIRRQAFTVDQAVEDIEKIILEKVEIELKDLLTMCVSKYQVIVYVLAVLELLYLKRLLLVEKGDGYILRRNDLEP